MGRDAQLDKMTYKAGKLGQIDLVFGLWSEFISGSVQAISTSSVYHLSHRPPWITDVHTDRQRLDQLYY